MKRVLYAMAAVMLIAGPASAADPDPWNDWYGGLNIGYSWGLSDTNVGYFTAPGGVPIVPPAGSITAATLHLDGIIGGLQIGRNWLKNNSWVFGLEADIQLSGERGDGAFLCALAGAAPGPCVNFTGGAPGGFAGTTLGLHQHIVWFATLRARLGKLLKPTLLAYVTGGLAVAGIDSTATLSGLTPGLVFTSVAAGNSNTNFGWVVGLGLEKILSEKWTGKLEYLYMDLGSVSGSVTNLPIGIMAQYHSHITDHILRVGLNYHYDK